MTEGKSLTAVDANILVYAFQKCAPEHVAAKTALYDLVDGEEEWGIPWPCCFEFLAAVTKRSSRGGAPAGLKEALAWLKHLTESPRCQLLGENDECFGLLDEFIGNSRVVGPKLYDARIAAICMAHGVTLLLTRDQDFALFPNLPMRNPIDPEQWSVREPVFSPADYGRQLHL